MHYKIFDRDFLLQWLRLNQVSTPCYLYDISLLSDTLQLAKLECSKFFNNAIIHYALKANHNPYILEQILDAGFGIDCVSGGEIDHALNNGFSADKIVFAGVGKSDWEINLALQNNICAFNCESLEELRVINDLACAAKKVAKVMIRINPNIDAKTHKHISTGLSYNKFGIDFEMVLANLDEIKSLSYVQIIGLHYHIGSQILDMEVYQKLAHRVNQHYQIMSDLNFNLTNLDLGGGLGINYQDPINDPIPNFRDYFLVLASNLNISSKIMVHFELGRALVGQCGIILSNVNFVKITNQHKFAVLDVGMNDMMRKALYDADHQIIALKESNEYINYCVVGPVCESSDIFSKDVKLEKLFRGDKIALLSCGAYGAVMANRYNLRPLISEHKL